ncbi:hypothetical protein KC355_g20463, partial [Hortaea werneckii]
EKRLADLRMAHEEEERQKRIEEGHESRRLTREQRLKEREVKRILHEEELKKIQEQEEHAASQDANGEGTAEDAKRVSARQAQTQKAEHKKHLQQLAEEEGKWYFDCSVCGVNGENVDDGTHSLACDRCGVWQHSKCHGLSPKQAEGDGFNFICKSCKRQEEGAKKPKIPPLKLGKKASSGSPEAQKSESRPSSATTPSVQRDSGLPPHVQRQLDNVQASSDRPGPSPGPKVLQGTDIHLSVTLHNIRLNNPGKEALFLPQIGRPPDMLERQRLQQQTVTEVRRIISNTSMRINTPSQEQVLIQVTTRHPCSIHNSLMASVLDLPILAIMERHSRQRDSSIRLHTPICIKHHHTFPSLPLNNTLRLHSNHNSSVPVLGS